jgi:hypothetical protein
MACFDMSINILYNFKDMIFFRYFKAMDRLEFRYIEEMAYNT